VVALSYSKNSCIRARVNTDNGRNGCGKLPKKMSLDCSITDILKADFNTLWRCTHRCNTVEVVTPYLMPDSTFLTLFFTQRDDRLIACDGGRIWELIRETIGGSEDDAIGELRAIAEENQISEGENNGQPVFFKECKDKKLLSSIAFDLGNFATMASNVLLATYEDAPEEKVTTFVKEVCGFLSQIIDVGPKRNLHFNHPVPGVSNVKFSAVVESTSRLSIVSCINGASFTEFRKNMVDAAFNLNRAWHSGTKAVLDMTVPVIHNTARGYDPEKLEEQIEDLRKKARTQPVLWSHKEELRKRLAA